jgi:hypothetical protein
MIPTPANVKKFRYISDYQVDKVVWRSRGSQSIPHAASTSDSVTITIPHGLGYRPLLRGVYSDDNFVSYYEVGNDPWFYDPTYLMWSQRLVMQVSSDATNAYVSILNWDTTRTIAWRLIGLAPSDMPSAAVTRPPTGDGGFFFNSDYNYLKLLRDDKQTITMPPFTSTGVSVNHGLGYRPIALAWTEFSGRTYQAGTETALGVLPVYSKPYTTDSLFVCELEGGGVDVTVHYKVYLDS